MKATRYSLLLIFLFLGQNLFSQARLSITDLQGLPSTGFDSAYFNTPYNNIQITIKNTGNTGFLGEADVLIMGGRNIIDTLFTDSVNGTNLQPGDSIIKIPGSYLFSSVNYVDGDNIVVVWPQARTSGIPYDSLVFNLFYISFQSIPELNRNAIIISPNPGTDYIKLGLKDINQFEYVRIFDLQGILVFESSNDQKIVEVKNWKAGLYFIEIKAGNKSYSGRVIIQ